MEDIIEHHIWAFPIVFALMWMAITTLLAVFSGWFQLAADFPDRPEEQPLLVLRNLSGSMGLGVSMRGILTLTACPSGLRVNIWRLFGPFSRDFFVPWSELTVTRSTFLLQPMAKLEFGRPVIGSLKIAGYAADNLAAASAGKWPESGTITEEEPGDRIRRLFLGWAAITTFASLFFIVAPMLMAPQGPRPPIAMAILFPAIFFGIGTIVRYFRER